MNNMSEVDDQYLLPPASVKDSAVETEIVSLKDIWNNEKSTFPKDKTDEMTVSNVKTELLMKVHDCFLSEKDPNLNLKKRNQVSQTSLVGNGISSASELLRDNIQEENGVFCNSNTSTCNSMNSLSANADAEEIFEYLTSETSETSEENNGTVKKMKTLTFDEISDEKVMNENIGNSNNQLYECKVDSYGDPLQSSAKIFYLSDETQNDTEIPFKIKNSKITNKPFDNNLSQNLQKEKNKAENGKVKRSMLPTLRSQTKPLLENINTDVETIAKETTSFQYKNFHYPLKKLESKKTDVMTVNSSSNENVPKNCKINSVEDNSTNESINMPNICDHKNNKNNLKLDKNFIYKCLKNWRKKYSWTSVEEGSWTISCTLCSNSNYTVKTLQIYQIKTSCDMYKVAKYLRNHNISIKHRLLNYFVNFDTFQKVYDTLKGVSKTFPLKYVLFENIKCIVKGSSGCLIDELDIEFLIKLVALVIREDVSNTIRSRICFGVGFICDPCRNILIVRYTDSQNYPQQSIITNYVSSDPPLVALKKDLLISNLEKENLTFGKIFRCSSCYPNSDGKNDNTLPIILPKESEFLDLMKKTNSILAYDNFVGSLSLVYNQNSEYFQSLNGHEFLKRPFWGLNGLDSFIFENFSRLKLIINTKYRFSTIPSVRYCKSFVLDSRPSFFALINATSCIANYLKRKEYKENITRDLSDKVEKLLKIMKEDKVLNSTYKETINTLSLYSSEIFNENYYNGIKNNLDFAFLFVPKRMANLLSHNYEADYDRRTLVKLQILLPKFIPSPVETFSISLTRFANHLLKIYSKNIYRFHDIIGLFNDSPELRLNYPFIFQFYIAFGTLPFIRTNSNSSLAFISTLRCYLLGNFNSDISNSLLTISTEKPTLIGCDINVLYQMVIHRIQEL